ncbi:bifunctional folylpolyglutamate synthase/dihydrofolate synthase [Magnetococcus sp. PR-3]|uniref:bifunctional folylpolyglutamate synthase/dihydrofolate synthase n=1 Tax=Magnetococcus sp. PR-3 TaxID=3120355 RepID=UPI002FCE4C28
MDPAASILDALLTQNESQANCTIDLGLSRMEALLAALGQPHAQLGPVIHVAGTNGKGSLIAFLTAMLQAAGYTVATYTSPHLITIHERIQRNGQPVDDGLLRAQAQRVLDTEASKEATFFERLTAVAFGVFQIWCAEDPQTVVLLETGLGGRLDATNVVHPTVTAITSMGLDHQAYLGSDMASIAREKAGILKKGVPVVAAPADDEALSVIQAHAQQVGAPLLAAGLSYHWQAGPAGWYEDEEGRIPLPQPALAGHHQWDNAAQAVAVARQLMQMGWSLSKDDLRSGVASAYWPGRLEQVATEPSIWLDGAHNPVAAQCCADFFRQQGGVDVMLFALMADKDRDAMLRPWLGVVKEVVVVEPVGGRAVEAKLLVQCWNKHGVKAEIATSTEQGLQLVRKKVSQGGKILVSGSLYLVGEAKKLL